MFGDLMRFDTGSPRELDVFQQWLDSLFSEGAADLRAAPRGSFPMINIGRTDDAVRVYVFAAGLGPDDLELSIQEGVLTVSGTRETQQEEPTGGERRTRLRRERFQGAFSRTISLPEGLDTERAEASCQDGVFVIQLPKREELKPRRISIQTASGGES